MSEKIISGTVSEYSAEEKYDADGYPYVHYLFRVAGTPFFCKTGKKFFIHDGHRIVVRSRDEGSPAEVTGMYNSSKSCSFGKTSGLKAHQPQINYILIQDSLAEKKRIYTRVHSSNYNYAQQYLSFMLVLENGMQLQADARTGKRVMEGDKLFIYKPEDTNGVSEFLNTTTGASSKLVPLTALGFTATLLASITALFWSMSLPLKERAFVFALGVLFSMMGLIGGVFEWNRFIARKKRFQDFMEEVERKR